MRLQQAVDIQILSRRKSGAGTIRIPLLSTVDELDLSKTEGGGDATLPIGRELLLEVERNSREFGKPITVGFGSHKRDTTGPQSSFIDSVTVIGETLFGDVSLNPERFDQVVRLEAWRSFSVELDKDFESASQSFEGWVLTGGVFTNNNAIPGVFKVAASDTSSAAVAVHTVALSGHTSEDNMTETTVDVAKLVEENAQLKAENQGLRTRISATDDGKLQIELGEVSGELNRVRGELKSSQGEVGDLRSKLVGVESKLETKTRELTELHQETEAKSDEYLTRDVIDTVEAAVALGWKPATFEKIGYEAADNKAAWLREFNGGKIDNFKALFSEAPGLSTMSATSSGSSDAAADDADKDDAELTEEEKGVFSRLGLGDKAVFAGVRTESEARKFWAEKIKAQAKEK